MRYRTQNQADDTKTTRHLGLHRKQYSQFIGSLIIIPWACDTSSKIRSSKADDNTISNAYEMAQAETCTEVLSQMQGILVSSFS